jgi:hypothetical protein
MSKTNMIKIHGRNCRELAHEIAIMIGKSVHFSMYNYSLSFDECDGAEIVAIAADAAKHYARIGKKAKAIAAETVRSAVNDVMISLRYARSFQS